jgi:hypothetical protein
MKQTVLLLVGLAEALIGAQPATLTPAQTLDRRGLGDLDFSPDRARLVLTVTEPVTGAARQRNPREPDGRRGEKHLIDRLTRILAWYDKYLTVAASPVTAQR